MVKIDHRHLAQDTLDNLLTEIVTREGTDYGDAEISIPDKKAMLLNLLRCGEAEVVYYSADGFCDIVCHTDSNRQG